MMEIVYFLFMFDSTVNCTDNTVLTLTAAVTPGTKVVSTILAHISNLPLSEDNLSHQKHSKPIMSTTVTVRMSYLLTSSMN